MQKSPDCSRECVCIKKKKDFVTAYKFGNVLNSIIVWWNKGHTDGLYVEGCLMIPTLHNSLITCTKANQTELYYLKMLVSYIHRTS